MQIGIFHVVSVALSLLHLFLQGRRMRKTVKREEKDMRDSSIFQLPGPVAPYSPCLKILSVGTTAGHF